ncbi:Phenylacetaldoxime dehydratase [Grimontia celer]|uniref:Phenylacetaldoxime dehydratase n=1 Tax=Grimontia celer TaxID=1796497 RepID=A0A128F5A6_9GAMM|nr:phenylacetaldoxime dehydratase family protein [Grimontia celer]CZF81584.1 Phenylacetaldoxime dehydratase [Grimontia celer]
MTRNTTGRKLPLRMPPGWEPPVPAWSSVFSENQQHVSMCIIGCQHKSDAQISEFVGALNSLAQKADVCDFATCEDKDGYSQTIAIIYWMDAQSCADWLHSDAVTLFWELYSDDKWEFGIFREVFNVPFERLETLFSGPLHNHGFSQIRKDIEGPIERHGYWGGMRDRIPLSAENPFEADQTLEVIEQHGNRVVVRAHENLCIIRSGQDWSNTTGTQREEYLNQIEPVLKAGMNFLRDEGDEVNCYSCRYMTQFLPFKGKQECTFGLAFFRTMSDLEAWSESHPTHVAIFNTFLEIAPKYGPDLQLQLWHEVSVLPAGSQYGEYINCTEGTGLLSGVKLS